MHLGGNHEFSTFRRTLIAILSRGDPGGVDEAGLADWMHAHLRVVTFGHVDPDSLGRLEREVLAILDPPLNLSGMTDTPIRRRVTALRRAMGSRRTPS